MRDEREALQQQIYNVEENLRDIQERMSRYPLSTDVPIHLEREERTQQEKLKELKRKLDLLSVNQPAASRALTEVEKGQIKLALIETACLEEPQDCKAVVEKLPFVVGVDCHARQHERVTRILEACIEHPDGLEELVTALASSSGNEAAAAVPLRPLHETLQKLLPQPVQWAWVTEAKALLKTLDVGRDKLEAYYLASCWEGARLPAVIGDDALSLMLDSLAKMPCHAPDKSPYLEFLLRLFPHTGEPAGQLSDYTVRLATDLGFDLKFLREKIARDDAAPAEEVTPVCLMIKITPSAWQPEKLDEPRRFLVNAWVDYAGSFEPLPEKEGEHTLESLPSLLERFVTECHLHALARSKGRLGAGYTLTVEVFLPLDLLDCDVDQWKIKIGKQARPVGARYQLVVRSWDRLYDPDYWTTWDVWTKKWNARPRPPLKATEERHVFIASCDEDYCNKLVYLLEQRGTVFMALSPMPPSQREGGAIEVFWPMLDSGTPIGLWLRCEDKNVPATREELRQLVCDEDLNALPRLVHARRFEAQTEEERGRLWNAVTLLWDDPERLPPDITSGKFETPKEQVTNS